MTTTNYLKTALLLGCSDGADPGGGRAWAASRA
jgi:hypothetical protein